MTREKFVYDSDEVAHIWFHQRQARARDRGDRIYFYGDTIYSYGSHFPMARLMSHKGRRWVLMTYRGYSPTTAKHLSSVRGAIPSGVFVHLVYDPEKTLVHKEEIKRFREEIAGDWKRAAESNVKNKPGALKTVNKTVAGANAYCVFFGLKTRFEFVSDAEILTANETLDAHNERRDEATRRREERDEAKAAARAVKRQREIDDLIVRWKAGEKRVRIPREVERIYLRVVRRGLFIQTSAGVMVSVEAAKTLLPYIRAGVAWDKRYSSVPIAIDRFSLDRIDADGTAHISCHKLDREEMERIAAQLKL